MARTAGLGKGLASLIPTETEQAVSTPQTVPCSDLTPNPFQPRQTMDDGSLESLAQSIRTHGVLQPLLVRQSTGGYEIVAGERRWRAAIMAGIAEVPVRIVDFDDRTMREVALVENLQREDLPALDIAESLNELVLQFSMTHDALAERLGWSRSAVTNKLRLLQLPTAVRQLLSAGDLTEGHGRALLGLQDLSRMEDMAQEAVERGWNVRQLEDAVRRSNAPQTGGAPKAKRGGISNLPYGFAEEHQIEIAFSGKPEQLSLHLRNLTQSEAHRILSLVDQNKGLIFPGK